jgi:hypothetical protein
MFTVINGLRSNAEGYDYKTYLADPESDSTASNGRKLCYLLFSVLVVNLGTSGYAFVHWRGEKLMGFRFSKPSRAAL